MCSIRDVFLNSQISIAVCSFKIGKQGYLPHCYSDKVLMSTVVNQDYSCDCNGESITTSFICRYFYLDWSLKYSLN